MRFLSFGLWLPLLVAGCGDAQPSSESLVDVDSSVGGGADGSTVSPGLDGSTGLGASMGCNKMDILFVIDNSGSMAEEQANLTANFPRFIDVLDGFRGGALDYRLAVTTTAMGDIEFVDAFFSTAEEGAMLKTPSMDDAWLERGEPNLAATFSELANVGVSGSFTEQPLKAAKYALVDRVEDGTNPERRLDALLALVFLTDEDDGSTAEGSGGGGLVDIFLPGGGTQAPVSDFIDAYDQLAMGRDRWAAAVIAGDEDPECTSEFGEASYAERLIDFVDQAGSQTTFGSICSGDLSIQLDAALNTFSAACDTFVPLI